MIFLFDPGNTIFKNKCKYNVVQKVIIPILFVLQESVIKRPSFSIALLILMAYASTLIYMESMC